MARAKDQLSLAWLDGAVDAAAREAARLTGSAMTPPFLRVEPTPARPVQAPLLVDVPTAARMLSCGRTYVYEIIKRGEVTTVKLDRTPADPGRRPRGPRRATPHSPSVAVQTVVARPTTGR